MNGVIAGYDPGGNGANGLALLFISDGLITTVESETVETAQDVLNRLLEFDDLLGIGVDTLTKWSTGKSGWRDADLTLRAKYRCFSTELSKKTVLSNRRITLNFLNIGGI